MKKSKEKMEKYNKAFLESVYVERPNGSSLHSDNEGCGTGYGVNEGCYPSQSCVTYP